MNKIPDLKAQLDTIEVEAGKLEPTDYEGLYKLLVTAYFISKDIIELQTTRQAPDAAEQAATIDKITKLEAQVNNLEALLSQVVAIASSKD